ncbi:beta-lactamase family protein [Streptomonospora sp. PA3]|uniref:serine hydrolase domain-containing protein n=1 Tax=Streptomonospora sp. PA3 TaxID=2607326 RepID=UPI0012DCDDD9|nr:serine hydrolase domain-containing protein [Streptomonospora sp. PA3]MUL40064.1 beta-lactamase family protein [Streptomonospora sp. PA3]
MDTRKKWALAAGAAAAAVVIAATQAAVLDSAGPGADAAQPRPGSGETAGIGADEQIALQQALNRVIEQGSSGAVAELVQVGPKGTDTWNGVAGVADRATRKPVDPLTHFRIASLSKPFVAATLLDVADEQDVALDSTLGELLPGAIRGGGEITLRMLLSHTSGLYSYNRDMPGVRSDPDRTWRPEELVAVAEKNGPVFEPGTGVAYSNTNYVLAAMVVEKLTGRPYEKAVAERVLRPLGLDETSIPDDSRVPRPFLHAYLQVRRAPGAEPRPWDVSEFNPTRWYGTAQVVSTVGDVNRFWQALLGGDVLSAAMLEKMLEVQATNGGGYGYALGPRRYTLTCGLEVWMHSGNIPGYRTWTVHGGGRHFTLFQARYTADPDPPAWAMIETAMCPTPGDDPAPTPTGHPTEDVGDTGRGQDG